MDTKKSILRWFGVIWIFVLAVVIPLAQPNWYEWGDPIAYSIAGLFALLVVFFPKALRPIFIVQTKIATFIGNFISKIVLILLFYFIIFPIGLILRMFGKDLLKKKIDKSKESYYITREKQPGNLVNQF